MNGDTVTEERFLRNEGSIQLCTVLDMALEGSLTRWILNPRESDQEPLKS